ncbi:hypothetical protein [Solimicrobium silvestre]|uniref:RsaL-like HTH domain-containing protein n=1 Tax=Solimicrobium silvestre TaxID=2099400 RepID=A0A2S9H360_9BURK|nr:hypothetical protein [Solimicrobium silvestre]PRC94373.1 hypothetical protein S2091_0994 [Solimicrobium silvestre]
MLKIYKTTSEVIPEGRLILELSEDKTGGGENNLYWITSRDKNLIRDLRHVMRENQTQFWHRFGVTQTQGSRFERGKPIPLPVLLLIRLYLLRVIDDSNLQQVRSPSFDSEGN